MNLELDAAHLAFRDEVRDFLGRHRGVWPKPGAPRSDFLAWQTVLIDHGYAARTIPRAYGGFGAAADILASRIIAEAFTAAGAPGPLADQGISMLVPTLLELGTEAQKQRWAAPTLRAQRKEGRSPRAAARQPTGQGRRAPPAAPPLSRRRRRQSGWVRGWRARSFALERAGRACRA